MANTVVLDVWRPATITPGTEAAGAPALADHLLARLDYNGDGARVVEAVLPFADYEGLEAEWLAGEAITVLQASINSWMTSPGFPPDHLPLPQRAIRGYTPVAVP